MIEKPLSPYLEKLVESKSLSREIATRFNTLPTPYVQKLAVEQWAAEASRAAEKLCRKLEKSQKPRMTFLTGFLNNVDREAVITWGLILALSSLLVEASLTLNAWRGKTVLTQTLGYDQIAAPRSTPAEKKPIRTIPVRSQTTSEPVQTQDTQP